MMKTISLKLPAPLANWLAKRANELGRSRSDLVRQALELIISDAAPKSKPSLYDLSRDLFENLGRKGPRDLSTNRKHLDDFGQ